jgi:hypothetical protein
MWRGFPVDAIEFFSLFVYLLQKKINLSDKMIVLTMEFIAASPKCVEVETENDEALPKSLVAADTTTFHSSILVTIR